MYIFVCLQLFSYVISTTDSGDYDGTVQSVEFVPGGSNVACINIPITDDSVEEGMEDFTVDLQPSNPDVREGDPSITTVNIIDDDGKQLLSCTFCSNGFTSFLFYSLSN